MKITMDLNKVIKYQGLKINDKINWPILTSRRME